MDIDDRRKRNALRFIYKFKNLYPGDVFEFEGLIYIKITNKESLYYARDFYIEGISCNAYSLTQNKIKYFSDDIFVTKINCKLIIEGEI